MSLLNPLTVFDGYIRAKTVVACIGYSASHSQNFEKGWRRGWSQFTWTCIKKVQPLSSKEV